MSLDPSQPPEFGEIEFHLHVPPVSQQAKAIDKQQIVSLVRSYTRPLQYLLDDDVTVDIEWLVHEKSRWETDASADVDNIVKPLLDGLCGPEGILIDDCQISSLSSTWFGWIRDDHRVTIRIKYDPDHFFLKDGLVFVRLQGALCYPVPKEVRQKGLTLWLAWLKTALTSRKELEQITGDYYPARHLLPRGFFHRTRLRGFPVYTPEELVKLV
jgi:Holliday junction resolvase RusA-like endonuclease